MSLKPSFLGSPDFAIEAAGQKAAQLHRLLLAGMPVPAGFVLAPELDVDAMSDSELEAAVARIGGFPVAARSSGNLEDLANASFAGQYVTVLEIEDLAGLRAAIARCRASAQSEQVLAYLKKNRLSAEKSRLTVFVQRMVAAKTAGVAFSIHPLSGREDHALVECCEGLGEKLVSGQTTPTQYVLNLEDGATVEHVPGAESAVLSEKVKRELCAKMLESQAYFGHPQDMEWAVDASDALYVLQSRPITTIQWRTDVEEFTNADFKDGGVSARVCTPMMASLYREAVMQSMPKYFLDIKLIDRETAAKERWIGEFYGRPYWNASAVKRALFKVPGFSEETFDQDLGIQKTYGPKGAVVVPTNLKTILGAIPVALALEKHYQWNLGFVKTFGPDFLREERELLDRIAAFPETSDALFYRDLVYVLTEFYVRTEGSYFTTIYNNSNSQSDFKSFIRKMDAACGGETSLIRLMAGLADVSHMDMQRGLIDLYRVARSEGFESPAWTQGLKEFLTENYFHGDAELELRTPRWGEVPGRIREIVEGMLKSGVEPSNPDTTILAQQKEFEAEVASVHTRIGASWLKRLQFKGGFEKHLGRVRAYLSRREEMREYSTKAYYIVRQYALEAGRRLGVDVFMIELKELAALAKNEISVESLSTKIAYRRAMYEGYRGLTPPNELGQGVSQRTEESFVEASADGRMLMKGLGCSPGQIEGLVRVIHSMDEIGQIQKGDILVTRFTDPGWTPALGLVTGIVTEVGGLLSHAAVIGREYGIPAVLNLPGATKKLATGQRVRVNGSSGMVELLDTVS